MASNLNAHSREPWNKGKIVGQKAPFRIKDIWALRVRLQMESRVRELALFNLGIDSKLRGCDLVSLKVRDVCHGDQGNSRRSDATQDPASCAVRDHAGDARSGAEVDQAIRAEVRGFLVPEPRPRLAAPGHTAIRSNSRRLGRGTWSGSR